MFTISSFYRLLHTGWLGRRFWYFRTLESTNGYIQQIPGYRLSHGLVSLADHQTNGKGQYGRQWIAAAGDSLTFSIVLKPSSNKRLQLFSLASMLALRDTLSHALSIESEIKWPNDLLIGGKKVAGLLSECRYNGRNLDRMTLGLGINVNQLSFTGKLEHIATSLRAHAGDQHVDRPLILAVLLNRLEPLLDQAADGELDLIRKINRSISGYGKWVSLAVDGNREKTPVKVLGVNEYGYLMVLTANDDIKTFTHEQVRIENQSG